ncbi:hypothetical protein [Lacinutrix sp. 5H-3-7-4]|uniref:hypothetical protein n=1 Tax=Lacinutrix sp. (strain 5H-3-7-4) TaxID=983544 RepID=UPI00020A3E40|nr:hypothetical protein [Lacinutrix sp. 5H-3-7-4]AEH01887.1 hypothetical protein Lacal_2041 [Lacinutrix sp. 5H-3-7-4]
MKKLLILFFLCYSYNTLAQDDFELEFNKCVELFHSENKSKALKCLKKIEKEVDNNSSAYGKTLETIFYYYYKEYNEKEMLVYYNKIVNSNLDDKEKNYRKDKPYSNYRFNVAKKLAYYFIEEKNDFEKGLTYIEKANSEFKYYTNSLASLVFQKINLAIWKYDVLNKLDRKADAISVILKRAFEYDYKNIYPELEVNSFSIYEKELFEKIYSQFPNPKELKIEIDNQLSKLKYNNKKNLAHIKLFNNVITIKTYKKLDNKEECINYLKNSSFYKDLEEKTK